MCVFRTAQEGPQEYILCAAIKLREPREIKTSYADLTICEIGYRHCDIFERFGDMVSRKPDDQGFFTSQGRFVTRKEAMKIAKAANQLNGEVYSEKLFSEDLY